MDGLRAVCVAGPGILSGNVLEDNYLWDSSSCFPWRGEAVQDEEIPSLAPNSLISLTEGGNVLPALPLSPVCPAPVPVCLGNVVGSPSAPQQGMLCSQALPCLPGLHHGSPGLISQDHLVSVPAAAAQH